MPFPTEEKYIQAAEQQLGIQFPESFRKKMLLENGGEVSVPKFGHFQLFPFFDSSDQKRMKRTCNHLVKETLQARQFGLSDNLIVIAQDGGGNYLVYKIDESGKVENEVYSFHHEIQEPILVANDFTKLKVFQRRK